jgi:hypothetical protein
MPHTTGTRKTTENCVLIIDITQAYLAVMMILELAIFALKFYLRSP